MPVNYERLKELARPKTYCAPIVENKRKAVSLKQLGPSIEKLSKPSQQNLTKDSTLNSRRSQNKRSAVDDVSKPQTTVKLCKNTIGRKPRLNKRDEITSLQIKNETTSVPTTAGKRHELAIARDDGDGQKADGAGKKADFEWKKADGDGSWSATDRDETKDDGGVEQSAVERLAARDDRDRLQTPVGRGDRRPASTVPLMDFLRVNFERLSQIHAECRRERWPDEFIDTVARPEVAADDEDATGRRDGVSASSCPLYGLVAAYSERCRRNVSAACLSATATIGGFFRRIGRVLTFAFLTVSVVLARDDGEGGRKSDGGGREDDFRPESEKADGDGSKDDGGAGAERSAVERIAAKDDRDRLQTAIGRGDRAKDDDELPAATVSLLDFLRENSERLSQIHAECRRERWPDECFDTVARPEVAADDEDATGRRDRVYASSCHLYNRLAAHSERCRRNVSTACLSAMETIEGFFRRIGRVLTFEFLTVSVVYTGTILERPF